MKVFIATLGFDWRHVIACLTAFKVSSGDELHLLVPRPMSEDVERSIRSVQDIARAMCYDIKIVVHEIDVSDPITTLKEIVTHLRPVVARDVDEIVLDLGGGLRMLVVMGLLSILMLYVEQTLRDLGRLRIAFYHEGRREILSCSGLLLKLVLNVNRITSERLEILRAVSEHDEISLSDLSYELRRDLTTVQRHCDVLEDLGVISVDRGSRVRRVRLTELAKLIL